MGILQTHQFIQGVLTTRLMRDLLDKVNNPSSLVHAAAPFQNQAGDDDEDDMVRKDLCAKVFLSVVLWRMIANICFYFSAELQRQSRAATNCQSRTCRHGNIDGTIDNPSRVACEWIRSAGGGAVERLCC
jgi:hypothetical protein